MAILRDAERFHRRLFEQLMAVLLRHAPTFGPPFAEERHGVARAKRLAQGISELIARNEEPSRRQRRKQPANERTLGLRIFFFEYGRDIVCTNACYKTSRTPPGALAAALRIRDDYLAAVASGKIEILEGD